MQVPELFHADLEVICNSNDNIQVGVEFVDVP
jgi:hypothetical protein